MALSLAHKQKIDKFVGYEVKDYIDLEAAISGVTLGPADLIKQIIVIVTENFELLGNEANLDASLAAKEAALAVEDALLTHTNSIVTIARDNADLDNAIAALNAAKT